MEFRDSKSGDVHSLIILYNTTALSFSTHARPWKTLCRHRRQGFIFYGGIVMDEIAHTVYIYILLMMALTLYTWLTTTQTHTQADSRSLYIYGYH